MTPEELALFRSGDPALFRRLVEQESPRLVGYAQRLTRDLDEARELAQQTWVRVFERRASFADAGPLSGWLVAVCRSLFHDGARARARRDRVEAASAAEAASRAHDSPSAEAGNREISDARVADALGGLAPQQRNVVILRILDGLSTRETATRLGIAEGTVKAALHQAVRKLRISLQGAQDAD